MKYALKRAHEAAQHHESVEITLNLGVVDQTSAVGTPVFRWDGVPVGGPRDAGHRKGEAPVLRGGVAELAVVGRRLLTGADGDGGVGPGPVAAGGEPGESERRCDRLDVLREEQGGDDRGLGIGARRPGLVMPCRWDVVTNEPRAESESKPAPDMDVPDDLSGLDDEE